MRLRDPRTKEAASFVKLLASCRFGGSGRGRGAVGKRVCVLWSSAIVAGKELGKAEGARKFFTSDSGARGCDIGPGRESKTCSHRGMDGAD